MTFDQRRVHAFYEEFLSAHNDDARKVAWRSKFDQELRFETLLEALDDDGPFSILDVGCGLGDLFAYLNRTGRDADYLGVDIVPAMVERARERHPDGRFEVLDLLTQTPEPSTFDIVVASGSLTVRLPKHALFVDKMLRRMLALSSGVVAVNFQSTRSFRQNPLAAEDPDLYHVDPVAMYATCRRLCRWTTLREDMLTSDVVIYMYPQYARSVRRYHRLAHPDPEGVAWLYLERHLPLRALRVLESAPPSAAICNLRGMAHHRLGETERAMSHYREALALDPSYESARLNLQGLDSTA
jgi:SAM-dependent methyltransferase